MSLFSGKRPDNIGLDGSGRLKPCLDKPNCVCSQTGEDKQIGHASQTGQTNNAGKTGNTPHQIDPIAFHVHPSRAINNLISTLTMIRGIHVITVNKSYLHAECKSSLMGFVDDLEFSLDWEMKVWHVRSASRLGHYDFEKNRQRVEQIRQLLAMNE